MGDLDTSVLSLTTRRQFQDALAFERQMALGMAEGPGLTAPKPKTTEKPQAPPSLPRGIGNALLRGTYGLGAQVGGVTSTVGTFLGSETVAEWGETAADFWSKRAAALPMRDQRTVTEDPSVLISPGWWAEHVAEALPGFATFLIPSLGAARAVSVAGTALKLTPEVIGRLAWIGSKVASPATFAAQEMGSVYNEVIARGGSREAAATVATEAALVAAGLGAINMHFLLGEGGGIVRRGARGAISNSIITFLASGSRGAMLGDDVLDILRDSANAVPVQGALGAGAAVMLGKGAIKATEATKPKAGEPTKPTADQAAKTQALLDEFQAKMRASAATEKPAEASTTPVAPTTPEVKPAWLERAAAEFQTKVATAKAEQSAAQHPEFDRLTFLLLDGKKGTKAQQTAAQERASQIIRDNPDADLTQLVGAALAPRAKELATAQAPPEPAKPAESSTGGVMAVGTDSMVGEKSTVTLGATDRVVVDEMIESVKRAQEEPLSGKRAPVPGSEEELGGMRFIGSKTLKPEWMKIEGKDYYGNDEVLSVLEKLKAGQWPKTDRQARIANQIEQALRIDAEAEKARAMGGPAEPEIREPTTAEREADIRTKFFGEVERLAQEEEAAETLSPWQQQMKDLAEAPAEPVESTVPASEMWPGMRSVRVSEQARPLLDGLQADSAAEAGRIHQGRGIRSDEAVAEAGKRLIERGEFTLDTILEAKPGTTWDADHGHAAVSILQALANRVAKLAGESLKESSGVSPEQFRDAYGLFETAAQAVSAVASETGRMLRSLRGDVLKETAPAWTLSDPVLQWGGNVPPGHPYFSERPVTISALLRQGGALGKGVSSRFLAEQIAALPTARQQTDLIGKWARLGHAGMELFYGSLLTPLSIARNAIAIPATLTYHIGLVGAAEAGRRFLRFIAPDRVEAARGIVEGSTGAAWAGLQQGLHDAWAVIGSSYEAAARVMRAEGLIAGLKAGEAAIREETAKLGPMTLEMQARKPAISAEQFPELQGAWAGLVDVIGLTARLPGITGLTAGDLVSKIINDRVGVAIKARELAQAQGLTGDAFQNEVARLIRERPPDVDQAGQQLANKNTFTGDEGMIGWMSRMMGHPLAKLFISPFTRTPLRIMEYTLEGTPVLQHVTKGWWQDVLSADAGRRDLALAKMGVGWSMMLVVGGLAANGVLTGTGPTDRRAREALERTGWRPLSLHIGDQYISFSGMEPLSSWLGMFADFATRAAELPEASADTLLFTLAIAAGDNLMTKRYVQGFSDIVNIFGKADPEEKIEALKNRLLLPLPFQGVLGIARREVDPQAKEARTVLDRYLRHVPGFSDMVPPRRNVITGEAQVYEGAWGPDWISPFFSGSDKADRVLDEIARLKGAGLSRIPDSLGGREEPTFITQEPVQPWGVPLSPQRRDAWIQAMTSLKLNGRTLHEALGAILDGSDYKTATDYLRAQRIQHVYDRYKAEGKKAMLKGDPELAALVAGLEIERRVMRQPAARQAAERERMSRTLTPVVGR